MQVRLFKPSVGTEELEQIREVFDRAWLGLGPKVSEFEEKWSHFVSCKESVGVNSCTAALHLAVSAFRFPEGKKILIPAITFASTATAALYNRLEPKFVDVDDGTGGVSLDDLERQYDEDCVAVMPVHFAGHPVKMNLLIDWAKSHRLKVIEDCAHSAGGKYLGRTLGTWGDIGCFSFEEKKCMTTGDGGMISSNDAELLRPLRNTRWVGIDKDTWQRVQDKNDSIISSAYHWYYEINELGYKYNMNDLMASIGLAQLGKLSKMNKQRERILRRYLDGISGHRIVTTAIPYDLQDSSYWAFMVRVKYRDRFIIHMNRRGISTGVHYMPLTRHPLFRPYSARVPVAESMWTELVTLPFFPDLTDKEIDYVIEAIWDFKD